VSGTYETSDVDRIAYIFSMFDVKKFETMYHHKLPFNSKDTVRNLSFSRAQNKMSFLSKLRGFMQKMYTYSLCSNNALLGLRKGNCLPLHIRTH
jgi:hypothetical protein